MYSLQGPKTIILSEESASQAYLTKTPIIKKEHSGLTDYQKTPLGYFDEHSTHKKTQDEAHWPDLSIQSGVHYQR